MALAGMVSLGVRSHAVVWLFFEELWAEFVPVPHGLQGRFGGLSSLWELLIVECDLAQDVLLEVLAVLEPMAWQHRVDPAIEHLDQAVCLGPHFWRDTRPKRTDCSCKICMVP